jgi:O-antigen/teichoic acid export membrane protein
MFWGNIIYSLSQWAIVVALAKFGNVEMVGIFSLALAIAAPIFMFTNLQLRVVQIADVGNEFNLSTYFSLRIYSSLLALFISSGILLLFDYQWETKLTIFIIGVAKTIESVSDILWGWQQKNERMDFIAKSMFLRGIISVISFASVIYFTGDIIAGSLVLGLSWGLVLLFYDIPKRKLIKRETKNEILFILIRNRDHIKHITRLIRIALPLGIVLAFISLNANIPRYFVEYNLGEASLGIFSALLYLMIPGNLIVNSMGQSMSLQMAKMFHEKNIPVFRNYLKNIIFMGGMISVTGLILSIFWGKELLLIFYTWEYAQQDILLIWIMGASFFIYLSTGLGYGMTAAGYFKSQIPLFAMITILTIVTNFIFVPRFGILGAVISVLVSGFAQFAGSAWILKDIICWPNRNH